MNFLIAPSLLSADWANLGPDAQDVIDAGADMLHLDVMDHHFVPNLTVGPLICTALRKFGIKAPIDVHLMVKPVDPLIVEFAKAGATYISFHPEASDNINTSVELIKKYNCLPGIAINPETPLDCIAPIMQSIDLILIMSVHPGFAGQKFMPVALEKLRQARTLIHQSGRNIRLSIDGGIKLDNIQDVAKAGADTFVLGSGFFCEKDYQTMVNNLRNQLKKVTDHG